MENEFNPSDYINDGNPIGIAIFARIHNDKRVIKLADSSIGVCKTSKNYFEACSSWVVHYGITSLWYAMSNLEFLCVETALGDRVCEFNR